MSVKFIVDSSVDMRPDVRQQVQVLPLTVRFGEEEFADGVTIDYQQFYEKLAQAEQLPTTSQVTPFTFAGAYEEALKTHDSVVVVTISSGLSGTYQSALLAAEEFEGRVFVVDSQSVTIAAGILVQYGLELAEQGLSAEQIAQELDRQKSRVRLAAVVDTLKYLQKGGRISKAVAVAGGMLSIKPILTQENGELKMAGKARGSKQANAQMNRLIDQWGGVDFTMPILTGHSGVGDELLQKYLAESAEFWQGREFPAVPVGSAVGTYAGPGAIAVAYFRAE